MFSGNLGLDNAPMQQDMPAHHESFLTSMQEPAREDVDMLDAEEASGELEASSHSHGDTEELGLKTAVSGSPPKLINTPPTTLNPRKPRTVRRAVRAPEMTQGPTIAARPEAIRHTPQGPRHNSARWSDPGTPDAILEDGRHIGGVILPKGIPFGAGANDMQQDQPGVPVPKLHNLGRSRSLPDFMEVSHRRTRIPP